MPSATAAASAVYNALVKTHHIVSPRKIARLRKSAVTHSCYALMKAGASPGILYCEGTLHGVRSWITVVQSQRYKEYQLVSRPAELVFDGESTSAIGERGKLYSADSVKEFGEKMVQRGIHEWWKKAMGYK